MNLDLYSQDHPTFALLWIAGLALAGGAMVLLCAGLESYFKSREDR